MHHFQRTVQRRWRYWAHSNTVQTSPPPASAPQLFSSCKTDTPSSSNNSPPSSPSARHSPFSFPSPIAAFVVLCLVDFTEHNVPKVHSCYSVWEDFLFFCCCCLNFIYFIFRERGRKGEEGEKHQCVVASPASPTGDLAATQACALTGLILWFPRSSAPQSTEPHQPGRISSLSFFLKAE